MAKRALRSRPLSLASAGLSYVSGAPTARSLAAPCTFLYQAETTLLSGAARGAFPKHTEQTGHV